jgi:hypothetical protein
MCSHSTRERDHVLRYENIHHQQRHRPPHLFTTATLQTRQLRRFLTVWLLNWAFLPVPARASLDDPAALTPAAPDDAKSRTYIAEP